METERHEVSGVEFDVIKERIESWRAFQLFKTVQQAEDNVVKIDAVMEIACYITDMQLDEFIDKCGGVDVPIMKIIETASTLIAQAYPKN